MEFRPCIDIHDGKVKQIVGGTLSDATGKAVENFVAAKDADYFANMFMDYGFKGGHVIILNKAGTPEYEASKAQAKLALATYKNGLQIGGGITPENAAEFIEAGASHVIISSYAFTDGKLDVEHLEKMVAAVGKEHVVLDLSCRQKDGQYFVVVDRWQTFTDEKVERALFEKLLNYADEFLIHAADVEGLRQGPDTKLISVLAGTGLDCITYAGGIKDIEDVKLARECGNGKVHVTVGSALDIYGGNLSIEEINNAI